MEFKRAIYNIPIVLTVSVYYTSITSTQYVTYSYLVAGLSNTHEVTGERETTGFVMIIRNDVGIYCVAQIERQKDIS